VLVLSAPLLLPEHLAADLLTKGSRTPALEAFIDERLQAGSTALYSEAMAIMERMVLAKALRHTGGNQSQAAKILNITRGTLRSRIRELGISIQQAVNVEANGPGPPPLSSAVGTHAGAAVS
jgi:two-component system nitrogen regulation response regulator GlnG